MSTNKKNPLDQPYAIALYKSMQCGYVSAYTYLGERDAEYRSGDSVRISEPVEIKFTALKNDEVIRNAVAACDAAEQAAYRELNEKLARIKEQRQQFLALTHQPAESAS